tara:strand:+ start:692 stop:814 length:123 start_codon:yes stop_codon:yes gene_type:complete
MVNDGFSMTNIIIPDVDIAIKEMKRETVKNFLAITYLHFL